MAKISSVKERKQLIIFLSLLTVFCLVFGFFYLKYNLAKPFNDYAESRTVSLEKAKLEKLVALKIQDSDIDGLNDYDELYQYETSPYLGDSDSDGYDDKTEIESGNDPNCLAGQICEQERTETGASQSSQLSVGETNLSVNEIRQIMLENGASESMLAGIDDATLEQMFIETVQETGIEPAQVEENANSEISYDEFLNEQPITEDSFTDITNLTPDEIREVLIASGADEEALSQVDDETLQAIYLEALAEQKFSTNTNSGQ